MVHPSATLLIFCPDRPGLVSTIARFVSEHCGNIINFDQHVDMEENVFFMRMEWSLLGFGIPRKQIKERFQEVGENFEMEWSLHFSDELPRLALFVSKDSHCLYDLLSRYESGDLPVEIPVIISNHEKLKPIADRFEIPFACFPITRENKAVQEAKEREFLEQNGVDTIILARYMQIVSEDFISHYRNQIINIHHSFLPAFPGAKPYHSAYERGVKIIGATSHYVTADLDEGPIIEQDVVDVSHKNSVKDFIRKGKDLEKVVLSRAVLRHVEHKVLVYNNKTVVFG